MKLTLRSLRLHALASSLFEATSLRRATNRLTFVQADPIRSPARAQDLILRHRVKKYHAGDLDKHYARLGLEEDFLYAYGFMPQSTWLLLRPHVAAGLTSVEQRVLSLVAAQTSLHPRELEAHLGREREMNPWGGYSKATTRTLHALHHRGLLRVVGRENGIRTYAATKLLRSHDGKEERLRSLVLLIAGILAPLPETSLRGALRLMAYADPEIRQREHSAVTELVESGGLDAAEVEGLRYVWPAGRLLHTQSKPVVRFLAPFDPVVWDRRRFDHFWGWPYRFEAYTPPAKRKMGYYAMPMLWRDDVIGWVNIERKNDSMTVEPGFAKTRPTERLFTQAFDEEVSRFQAFLLP